MTKAIPAAPFPDLSLTMLDGSVRSTGLLRGKWGLIVVYRGHHCPRCKDYIRMLEVLAPQFAARNVEILVGSADPSDLARKTVSEEGWTLPVFCALSLAHMRDLGLYVTDPGADTQVPGPYAEPGVFLTNPDGILQTLCISNSPSARPDLTVFLDGVIGTQDRNLPIRGTADL